ncbi:MAG: hypothetical protein ACOCRK_09790 [bacterium]
MQLLENIKIQATKQIKQYELGIKRIKDKDSNYLKINDTTGNYIEKFNKKKKQLLNLLDRNKNL